MVRLALAAACSLALAGVAAAQPIAIPQPLGGPIVNSNGQMVTGLDAHPVASPWTSSIDLGVSGSEGNSSYLTLRAGFDVKYDDPEDFAIVNAMYILSRANSGDVANKGFLLARNEMPLDGISWYAQGAVEYDEFCKVYLRLASHSGFTFTALQDGTQLLKLRAGAGGDNESGGESPAWILEGQAGLDYEYTLTARTKFLLAADYYPDVQNFSNYRLRGRAAFDMLLDPQNNIYLRIGLFDRYDSRPYGSKRNDLDYYLMLSFRF
jgi:hypothetical protein